jgi:hypothetical protein
LVEEVPFKSYDSWGFESTGINGFDGNWYLGLPKTEKRTAKMNNCMLKLGVCAADEIEY